MWLRKSLTAIILTALAINSSILVGYYIKSSFTNLPLSQRALAQSGAKVYVDPANTTGVLYEVFTINVVVENVTDLYGIDIKFSWDPSILEYVSHTAKIPVEDYPDGILHEPGFPIKDDVNATEGTYWLAYASMAPAPSFDGSGIAFNMTFNVTSVSGACVLDIVSADLADSNGDPLSEGWEIEDGLFSPVGAPVARFTWWPEIGVVEKPVIFNASESYDSDGGTITKYYWDFGDETPVTGTTEPVISHNYTHTELRVEYTVSLVVEDDSGTNSSVLQREITIVKSRNLKIEKIDLIPAFSQLLNSTVEIKVTVANTGSVKENFTLSIYYNTSASWVFIEARNITQEGEKGYVFEWNTTGVEPEKYYVIKANATILPYEDETDNTKISSPIYITSEEIHDMVVTEVSVKASHGGSTFSLPIIRGEDASFTINLLNNGTVTEENLNVTLYSNSSLIKQWLINSTQGYTITLTWTWTEITQIGIYNITVYVAVENDTNPNDNSFQQYVSVIDTPHLNITYIPSTPVVNTNVTLDASNSEHMDPNGQIVSYTWEIYEPGKKLGDVATARISGESVLFNFDEAGNWTIVLTVKDNYGITYTTKRTLTQPYRLEMPILIQSVGGGIPLEFIVIPVIVLIILVVAVIFYRRTR